MKEHEQKIKEYMLSSEVLAEHLTFDQSCHSVEEAALAAGVLISDLVKNVCLVSEDGDFIVAIVKGETRVSTSKVAKAINNINLPRTALPDEVLLNTGYICGGVPSFGYKARFLVDEKVLEKEVVYTGGGSENSLIKISVKELIRANNAKVAKISKK